MFVYFLGYYLERGDFDLALETLRTLKVRLQTLNKMEPDWFPARKMCVRYAITAHRVMRAAELWGQRELALRIAHSVERFYKENNIDITQDSINDYIKSLRKRFKEYPS